MTDTNRPIQVLGFAGSLRQGSYNRALLRTAKELLPEDMSLEIVHLDDIPLYNADLEAQGTPVAVQQFQDKIRATDALLIATPEYNYSITGVLKNAIDWASRRGTHNSAPLDHKPAAIMGAGGRLGTVRAQMHLREILLHNQVYVVPSPQVLVASAYQEFDENGRLANERYRQAIRHLLENLVAWTRRMS